jgi:TRAP-type C4-dicarboxylate transport system substrate-binding protein
MVELPKEMRGKIDEVLKEVTHFFEEAANSIYNHALEQIKKEGANTVPPI